MTFKSWQITEQGPVESNTLRPADVPVPRPGPHQLRIRVGATGVCHTDLHIVEGDLPPHGLPRTPGHQIVGTVDATGEQVTAFNVGDRVGIGWLHSTCGRCAYCRTGRENLCENATFTGYDVDGGYGAYVIANEGFTFHVPDGFSDVDAAPLLCGGVIGYRAYRLADARPGSTIGLYGFGSSAHLVAQIAVAQGLNVRVYTRGKHHRELALRLGASWAGAAEDGGPDELDAAVIFAPAGPLVPMALKSLRKGASLVLAGIHMSPVPSLPYELLYGERVLRTVANYTVQDARELLALASAVPLRTVVQTFPLDEATHALRALKHGDIEGSAVLTVE